MIQPIQRKELKPITGYWMRKSFRIKIAITAISITHINPWVPFTGTISPPVDTFWWYLVFVPSLNLRFPFIFYYYTLACARLAQALSWFASWSLALGILVWAFRFWGEPVTDSIGFCSGVAHVNVTQFWHKAVDTEMKIYSCTFPIMIVASSNCLQ